MGWYDDYGPGGCYGPDSDEDEFNYHHGSEGGDSFDSRYGSEDDYCDGTGSTSQKRQRRDYERDAAELRNAGDSPWSGEDGDEDDVDRYEQRDLDEDEVQGGRGRYGMNGFVATATPPNEYEEDESELEALREEALLPLEDVARRLIEGAEGVFLSPHAAALALGYEEIDASFLGSAAAGGRVPVGGAALPSEMRRTPYAALRAFDTGSARGWGVCCTEDIKAGDVVVEMVGRLLSEAEFEQVCWYPLPAGRTRIASLTARLPPRVSSTTARTL